MKGIKLESLTQRLHKVVVRDALNPARQIQDVESKLAEHSAWIRDHCGKDFDFYARYYDLPLKCFERFSFDELCKLYYSTSIMMERDVDRLFLQSVDHELVRKIISSMWRWGCGKGTWNEVVETYNGIRNFRFVEGLDFEIQLDYTTGWNEFGYSKFSRTYLDGVFAYLVYYKSEHVMTIGFSVMGGKQILIQQVQLVKQKGNRFLYKLPQNRLEFVIELFEKNFPKYKLYVIDGEALVDKVLGDYTELLNRTEERLRRAETDGFITVGVMYDRSDCELLQRKIAHAQADRERLIEFYSNGGRFNITPKRKRILGLDHHPVAA